MKRTTSPDVLISGVQVTSYVHAAVPSLLPRRRCCLSTIRVPITQGNHAHLAERPSHNLDPSRDHTTPPDQGPLVLGREQRLLRLELQLGHGSCVPIDSQMAHRRTSTSFPWFLPVSIAQLSMMLTVLQASVSHPFLP